MIGDAPLQVAQSPGLHLQPLHFLFVSAALFVFLAALALLPLLPSEVVGQRKVDLTGVETAGMSPDKTGACRASCM